MGCVGVRRGPGAMHALILQVPCRLAYTFSFLSTCQCCRKYDTVLSGSQLLCCCCTANMQRLIDCPATSTVLQAHGMHCLRVQAMPAALGYCAVSDHHALLLHH